MKKLSIYPFLKIIFSVWGLQVFAPFYTSIGSVRHPGYLPYLCSNGKYCLAEMDGKKMGDCQWDELTPISADMFIGKMDTNYFLVGPRKYHNLGSRYPALEFKRHGIIIDSLTGLYAVYDGETNDLSEFIFSAIPWKYHGTPYLYGHAKDSILLYNMNDNEKYFTTGDGIKLQPPYVFILQEGLWVPHDLSLKMLFHEGRQSYLVYHDDLVMFDEPVKNNQINPVFINKDKGLIAVADSSFSLLLPYQYLRYDSSRSESLMGYLVREDSAGNPILYYPDKSRVFEEDTEWLYEYGKVYWVTDSTTGLLSSDRLSDVVVPERIDFVDRTNKLFLKYLNAAKDSFRAYNTDLKVSGEIKGRYADFFWGYFFLTFNKIDTTDVCRMYDWKGNLIRVDHVREVRSFRSPEAGKTIIRYYGDTIVDALGLPDFCRNMEYSFSYGLGIYDDAKLHGSNEFFSFAYDLKSKTFTREFRIVDQPDPNMYRDYIKAPQPPPYTYRHFFVTKENGRYLINCTKPGVICEYVVDEMEVNEFESRSNLIMTDYEASKTIAINSEGSVIYSENYDQDIWVHSIYGANLLFVENDIEDTTIISVMDCNGIMLLHDCKLEDSNWEEYITCKTGGSFPGILYFPTLNVKIIDYQRCPLTADSLQGIKVYLFSDFGIPDTSFESDQTVPILKYPWIARSTDHRQNSNFYSDTELGRIYINSNAPNPYFADPDIIRKVSYEGRVIDCSGK